MRAKEVAFMKRTELLQEIRRMRFESIYTNWHERVLTQEEAARILGVNDRTFRCCINRYEDDGLCGLQDKRLVAGSGITPPGSA